ncbi:hypothetical protein BMH31_08035 [Leucobacter sp. OLIS6]|nr:hypothetical protein BMH29_01455 [Leucobacter sp. OLDS2]PIJ03406.1 hypothetical protein BMH31_08035 [Leucobacter sp. OLIS6]
MALRQEMRPESSWWSESLLTGVLNGLTRALRTMPSTARGRLKGITERADEVERSLEAGLANMQDAVEELRVEQEARLEEIRDEASRYRNSLDTELAVADQKLASLSEAIQAANQTVQEQAGRLDRVLSDQQASFEKGDQERRTRWEKTREELTAEVDAHRQLMEEQRDQSRKVLEAIGVEATASGYGTYAKEQGEAADRWRIIAVAVFGVAIVWFIASPFLLHPEGSVSPDSGWLSFLPKWGGTLLAAGAGAWASRESGLHRKEQRKAKQIQLALAALEPFVANMHEDHQEELRVDTARSIFVRGREVDAMTNGKAGSDNGPELQAALTQLASMIGEAVGRATK